MTRTNVTPQAAVYGRRGLNYSQRQTLEALALKVPPGNQISVKNLHEVHLAGYARNTIAQAAAELVSRGLAERTYAGRLYLYRATDFGRMAATEGLAK